MSSSVFIIDGYYHCDIVVVIHVYYIIIIILRLYISPLSDVTYSLFYSV